MNKVIDKLAWIFIKDGKLLMVRSKGKELFYLPGGKREAGESDEQALVREIKEEISVDLVPDSIKYVDIYRPGRWQSGRRIGATDLLSC